MAVDSTKSAANPFDALTKTTDPTKLAAIAAASRKSANKQISLGQEQFLKLMTTQMTHQNPNEPMKNSEFLSQMAQFGTVSGIQDLQQSFATFANSIQSDQALQAAGLVGRYVSVQSPTGVLAAGGEISGKVNLATSTPSLQIAITNATTGELVKNVDLGTQSAGDIGFAWDGTNEAGTLASPGSYNIVANAMVDGKNVAQTTAIDSKVESVSMANSTTGAGMKVNLLGGSSVYFSQIQQIL
jgi:flagellar basal-body rod modification protein FlgD